MISEESPLPLAYCEKSSIIHGTDLSERFRSYCLPPRRNDGSTKFCSSLPIRFINLDSDFERRVQMEHHFKERCANRGFERFRAITLSDFDDLVDRGPADLASKLLSGEEFLRSEPSALRTTVREYSAKEGTSAGALCLMSGTCRVLDEFHRETAGNTTYNRKALSSGLDISSGSSESKPATSASPEPRSTGSLQADHSNYDVLLVMEDDISAALFPLSVYAHAFDEYLIGAVAGANASKVGSATDNFYNHDLQVKYGLSSSPSPSTYPVAGHLERVVLPNQFPALLLGQLSGRTHINPEALGRYPTTFGLAGTGVTFWNKEAARRFTTDHYRGESPMRGLDEIQAGQAANSQSALSYPFYSSRPTFGCNAYRKAPCETDMAMNAQSADWTIFPWLFVQRLYNPAGILQLERISIKEQAKKGAPAAAHSGTDIHGQSDDSLVHVQSFVSATQASLMAFELASLAAAEGMWRWDSDVGLAVDWGEDFRIPKVPASPHQAAHLGWLLGARISLPYIRIRMAPWRILEKEVHNGLVAGFLQAVRWSDRNLGILVFLWLTGVVFFVLMLRAISARHRFTLAVRRANARTRSVGRLGGPRAACSVGVPSRP